MLSSPLAAGRGIRRNGGASCPFGSLDRGGCGLVVGDVLPCCPKPGRSRWEDCLYLPLPCLLLTCSGAATASPQPLLFAPGGCWGS